ncbi:HAMP domain-containing histidine kinase [bacterium]|nr:HAMP domain-containing histidine kinase [bacterium]
MKRTDQPSSNRVLTNGSLMAIVSSAAFAGLNLHRGLPEVFAVNVFMFVAFLVNHLVHRRTGNTAVAGGVGMSVLFIFVIMASESLGVAALVWVYPIPVPAFYFLGLRRGLTFIGVWSVGLAIAVGLGDVPGVASLSVKFEMGICYAVLVTMAYRMEAMREAFIARQRGLTADLEAAGRAKDEFLGRMSHEFRTPLNAILGFTQLLGQRSDLSPDSQAYLDRIEASGRNLLAAFETILDFVRLQSDQAVLACEPIPLVPLLQRIRDEVEPVAASRGVGIVWPEPADLPAWTADPPLLHGALRRVVVAAVRRTPPWGQVEVALDFAADGAFRFTVEDGGPLLTPEELAVVFEPFTPLATQRRGIGLDLPIVSLIAQRHGGRALASSGVGGGLRVRIELPPPAAPAPAPAPEPVALRV